MTMNEFTLKVTGQEADLIVHALAQLPFAQVAGLIPKVQEQCRAQLAAAQAPAEVVEGE